MLYSKLDLFLYSWTFEPILDGYLEGCDHTPFIKG